MGRPSNMGNSHSGLTDDGGAAQMDALAALRGEFKERKDAILNMYEKGPAETAISPSHGSNNPDKESAVNDRSNTIPAAPAASGTGAKPVTRIDLLDATNFLTHRAHSLRLMAEGIRRSDKEDGNALLVVINDIETDLYALKDGLENLEVVS